MKRFKQSIIALVSASHILHSFLNKQGSEVGGLIEETKMMDVITDRVRFIQIEGVGPGRSKVLRPGG